MEAAGEKIPGSKYYRQFCYACKQPIRVTEQDRTNPVLRCNDCLGRPRPTSGKRARINRSTPIKNLRKDG